MRETKSTARIIQEELFGPRDTSGWQIQRVGEKWFRYLPDPNDGSLVIDFDGTGKTVLKVTKQSQDRYQTRLPPDEENSDGKLIRSGPWSNFSDLFIALREEWLKRARRKQAEAQQEQATAALKKAQAEHDQAIDGVVAAAKSIAEKSQKISKFLVDPALVTALQQFYRARGEQHWHSVELDAAIVGRICFLLEKPKNGKTLADEHRYIYNTAKEWQRDHFATKSIPTLRRAFKRLENCLVLIAKQPEGRKSRRKWVRPNPEVIKLITSGVKGSNCAFPSDQIAHFPSDQITHFPSDSITQSDQCGKKSAFKGADFFPPAAKKAKPPATSTSYESRVTNSVSHDEPAPPEFLEELKARKEKKAHVAWCNAKQPATKA
jgi:hypothetical protein